MKKEGFKRKIQTFIVVIIALIAVFFTSPKYFSQELYRPSGSVFIGMTGYFEDFYYYLDQFYQGKQGNWLTENRFSIERFPPTLVYFDNVLLGKLGGIIGFESYESYNFFGLLFKLLFIIGSFLVIKKIFPTSFDKQMTAFLIFLCSTGFPNIIIQNGAIIVRQPTEIFRSANLALARFGTSPSGMLVNFLFVVLFLVVLSVYQKELKNIGNTNHSLKQLLQSKINIFFVVGIILAFSLMIFADPVIALLFLLTIFSILLINKISPKRMPRFYTIVLLLIVLCAGLGLIFILNVQADTVYRLADSWDVTQYLAQVKSLGVFSILKGFSLLLPFGLVGLFLMIKKKEKTIYEQFGIIIVCISLIGYSVPLIFHISVLGFRFLSPSIYIFFSVFVLFAFEYIASKITIKNLYTILLVGYFGINLVGYFRAWSDEFKPLTEPYSHFAYIPTDLYKGLVFLRNARPLDGNVLASSTTSIDLMIPGIAGRYTFSGHSLTTYNAQTKDNNSSKFFFEWTDEQVARNFLRSNNIRFIFVTVYSQAVNRIDVFYPFLTVVYANPMVTIYRYDY